MLLQAGITGFQPTLSIGESEFKAVCYSSFGSNRVAFVEGSGSMKNFYECIINRENKRVHILLNSHYPFVAFITSREADDHYLTFINDIELSNTFKPYYKVLYLEQLNEPVNYTQQGKNIIIKNENNLHQDELKQLVYWKPKTVGEIVFNYWD
ncbi:MULTISPECIES: hypothetical protein [unclassified Sporosarcina]|uniref:hypothetical protein n=1 Tax=unclassified Sporosarcina TaxID=2647733 RepID=UPI002040A131|nr:MULTISPECIES: hypothetical protein [unclassified Sporosarcina]GKV67149.1 hypothetical protein NCCP2331_33020 [Sporosarcina sp. NCCP-2331]GLB57479.1 hypothetical protein NCCP2378_32670 [Sporosarcina sp. NCCP-2378]